MVCTCAASAGVGSEGGLFEEAPRGGCRDLRVLHADRYRERLRNHGSVRHRKVTGTRRTGKSRNGERCWRY